MKNSSTTKQLLEKFKNGSISLKDTLKSLESVHVESLGYASVDHLREKKKGFPEVVYGAGKSVPQIKGITEHILNRSGRVLITRVGQEVFEALPSQWGLQFDAVARCIYREGSAAQKRQARLKKGNVMVIAAGTSDLPVAQEAALTARLLGCRVTTLFDVGVAGIHRLLAHKKKVEGASVIICAAGMEGALPSVVGGLARGPVIAVPTSVGYGASFHGVAALLGMLNSCTSGVTVVNIDNGFGAGFAAYQMLRIAN